MIGKNKQGRGRTRVVRGRPAAAGPMTPHHHRLFQFFFSEQMPGAFAEEPSGSAEISVRAPTQQRSRRTRICDPPATATRSTPRLASEELARRLASRRFFLDVGTGLMIGTDWGLLFPAL